MLVVDDEPQILRALQTNLRGAGYEVDTAATAKEALANAAMRPPDAVILDLVLPDGRGTDVSRELRQWTDVPIIVLSAVGEEREKVAALDAGADDYVTKPFGIDELLARLRAALRRAVPSGETVIEVGDLSDRPREAVGASRREASRRSRRTSSHCSATSRRTAASCSRTSRSCARSGARLPDRVALHPRVCLAAPPQARAGSRTPALPAYRTRRGVPLRRSERRLELL